MSVGNVSQSSLYQSTTFSRKQSQESVSPNSLDSSTADSDNQNGDIEVASPPGWKAPAPVKLINANTLPHKPLSPAVIAEMLREKENGTALTASAVEPSAGRAQSGQ